ALFACAGRSAAPSLKSSTTARNTLRATRPQSTLDRFIDDSSLKNSKVQKWGGIAARPRSIQGSTLGILKERSQADDGQEDQQQPGEGAGAVGNRNRLLEILDA